MKGVLVFLVFQNAQKNHKDTFDILSLGVEAKESVFKKKGVANSSK